MQGKSSDNTQSGARHLDPGIVERAQSPIRGIGRAVGGAIIFSLPMMMTMEMWYIGFYIDPLRLIILILFTLPLFYGISSIVGFEKSKTRMDNIVDVFVAYAVAFATTTLVLGIFAVINRDSQWGEIFVLLLLQAVPGSLGALLARSVVGNDMDDDDDDGEDYGNELITLIAGALFLAFNLAPTEEMVLISYMMTPWHVLALVILTLLIMQIFATADADPSVEELRAIKTHIQLFTRFTSTGYILAIAISIFMLWIFGRTDHDSFHNVLSTAIVLGFPAGIGAAAARLII